MFDVIVRESSLTLQVGEMFWKSGEMALKSTDSDREETQIRGADQEFGRNKAKWFTHDQGSWLLRCSLLLAVHAHRHSRNKQIE